MLICFLIVVIVKLLFYILYRPRSPACDASQTEPLNQLQPKDCLNGNFGSSTSSRKHDLTVMEGKAGLIRGLHMEKAVFFSFLNYECLISLYLQKVYLLPDYICF